MLRIHRFTFNPFSENTYVLVNEQKQCWIIDPGMYTVEEQKKLVLFIEEKGLTPQSIINTHAHLDHIFGASFLIDKYDIPFLLHEMELPVLQGAKGAATLFGFQMDTIPQPSSSINVNENLILGTDTLEVRFTPGHSPGSVVFYEPNDGWLIGGDVLFENSIGRTDLPGGSLPTLLQSIKTELFTLPDTVKIFPGHGDATTVGRERQENPFLK